jgi:hypothetical protein
MLGNFTSEQDALNRIMHVSTRLEVKWYGELWALHRDRHVDGVFILHFPNRGKGSCTYTNTLQCNGATHIQCCDCRVPVGVFILSA